MQPGVVNNATKCLFLKNIISKSWICDIFETYKAQKFVHMQCSIFCWKHVGNISMFGRSCVLLYVCRYVTGFAKRDLITTSSFLNLRMCNSVHVCSTALKFCSRIFLSLYVLV